MEKDNYFTLGTISKLHGYKGELTLFVDADHPDDYRSLKHIFLFINNRVVPYFIELIEKKGNATFKVKLEGVETEDQAKKLLKKEVLLPLDELPQLEGNKFYFHEVIGFVLEDKNYGVIGDIDSVIAEESNPLFKVVVEDKEVLIPIHDEFLQNVDRENKTITVDCPEGLIELYMGDLSDEG